MQHRVVGDLVARVVEGMQLRHGHETVVDPVVPRDGIERPVHLVRPQRRQRVRVIIFIAIVEGERHDSFRRGGPHSNRRNEPQQQENSRRNGERSEPNRPASMIHHGKLPINAIYELWNALRSRVRTA
jgi:hypothetical protein